MPVIRRKLASSPVRSVRTPAPIRRPQVPQTEPQQPRPNCDRRAMSVKDAARYLSASPWQIRKWKREGFLESFRYPGTGKPKDMFAVEVLDAFFERSKETAA